MPEKHFFLDENKPRLDSLKDLPKFSERILTSDEEKQKLQERFSAQFKNRLFFFQEGEYTSFLPGILRKLVKNVPREPGDPREPQIVLEYLDKEDELQKFETTLTQDGRVKADKEFPKELQHLNNWNILEDIIRTAEILRLDRTVTFEDVTHLPQGEGDGKGKKVPPISERPKIMNPIEQRREEHLKNQPTFVADIRPGRRARKGTMEEYKVFVYAGEGKSKLCFGNVEYGNADFYYPLPQDLPERFSDPTYMSSLSENELAIELRTALNQILAVENMDYATLAAHNRDQLKDLGAIKIVHGKRNFSDEEYEEWFARRIQPIIDQERA